jgi:hypothetical protein
VILEFQPVGLSEPLKRSYTLLVNSTAEKGRNESNINSTSMLQQDIRTVERRTPKASNLQDYIERLKKAERVLNFS